MTLDEEFEMLVDSIPGFAGWYVANDGTPTVQLVDVRRLDIAQLRLASRVERVRMTTRPDGTRIGANLRAQQATYDFRQLRTWSRIAESLLDVEPAAVYVDVDETMNRVAIGVADAPTAFRVAQGLVDRGVPTSASSIEIVGRPQLTGDSITQHVRPVPGGIIINPSSCTLGFNANFGGTRAFVTASHCTVASAISARRACSLISISRARSLVGKSMIRAHGKALPTVVCTSPLTPRGFADTAMLPSWIFGICRPTPSSLGMSRAQCSTAPELVSWARGRSTHQIDIMRLLKSIIRSQPAFTSIVSE